MLWKVYYRCCIKLNCNFSESNVMLMFVLIPSSTKEIVLLVLEMLQPAMTTHAVKVNLSIMKKIPCHSYPNSSLPQLVFGKNCIPIFERKDFGHVVVFKHLNFMFRNAFYIPWSTKIMHDYFNSF